MTLTVLNLSGAGSVLMHVIANGGNTQPPRFRAAMFSSTPLVEQYTFDNDILEVSVICSIGMASGVLNVLHSKFIRTPLSKPGTSLLQHQHNPLCWISCMCLPPFSQVLELFWNPWVSSRLRFQNSGSCQHRFELESAEWRDGIRTCCRWWFHKAKPDCCFKPESC